MSLLPRPIRKQLNNAMSLMPSPLRNRISNALKMAIFHPVFFPFYEKALHFSLRGLGFNHDDVATSGEVRFLKKLVKGKKEFIAIDVGAYHGFYSNQIMTFCPEAKVTAFEPHPETYTILKNNAEKFGYTAINSALSDCAGKESFFTAANGMDTVLATLLPGALEHIHDRESKSFEVNVTTLDDFLKNSSLSHVDLLKVDAEGADLKVLQGAKESLRKGIFRVIQFEIEPNSALSRIFLRDFMELLPNFSFYRLHPTGLFPLEKHKNHGDVTKNIFADQNIVAFCTT